ncbi:MAG: DUF2577 family protein [Clostridiales bacterium]|nr:DUF2577 family protein [Flavonifractor sp.]MDU2195971.1 DUF2577 family protein [Clostridiales bacterium]
MNTFEENAGRIARSMERAAQRTAPPSPFLIGEVLSPEPLRVRAGGLDLDAEALRINEALLKGYRPKLVGTLMSLIPKDEVTTEVKKDDLERGEHALKKGDRVVVLTEDFQTYYILCKVVET